MSTKVKVIFEVEIADAASIVELSRFGTELNNFVSAFNIEDSEDPLFESTSFPRYKIDAELVMAS